MKYIITGSLGNISKPVVQQLTAAGHAVTVISSNADKQAEIEALGATAAIGSVEDRDFLAKTFAGADAAYLMIPPNMEAEDVFAAQTSQADNYLHALKESGIKNVVQLSSIGAHMRKGAGPIDGLGYFEEQLGKLTDVNIKMLRPSYFFANLHGMGGLIKHAGIMGANFGNTDEKIVLTHQSDIAEEVAKQLLALDFTGHSIQYIASDERSSSEIAAVLGAAIGKPETPWVTFSDADYLQGLLQAGLPNSISEAYTQMGKGIREGQIQADFQHHKPVFGNVKLEDFAKEFAAVYAQS